MICYRPYQTAAETSSLIPGAKIARLLARVGIYAEASSGCYLIYTIYDCVWPTHEPLA